MSDSPGRQAFVPFAPPDIGDAEIAAVLEAMRSGWLTTGPRAAAFEAEFAAALAGDLATSIDVGDDRTHAADPTSDSDPTGAGDLTRHGDSIRAGDPTRGRSRAAGGSRAETGLHAVALNSATAGLHLALEALGVGPGDEVIVPTWTFTSTAEVVRYLDATPVFVDVDPDTLNIDLAAAAEAVTAHTRAVLPVHFAGRPVDRAALAAFAKDHDLRVVEDAAHAFPAVSQGRAVGVGESDAVVFSFYATKTMTTGEGGMVVTADAGLAARMRTMRLHGISRDVFARYAGGAGSGRAANWAYEVIAPGYKYNLTDPAAAMGRVQLRRAVAMRQAREAIAGRYDEAFADLPVRLPAHGGPGDVHAWHLYVLRPTAQASRGRDEILEALARDHGVGASVHFIPLHRHPYWRDHFARPPHAYPVAEAMSGRAFSLPIASAHTSAQVDRVIAAVRAVCA